MGARRRRPPELSKLFQCATQGDKYRDIEPGAYVPFGRGPLTCIGMQFGKLEVKVITVALLQRYHLELFPGQTFPARTVPTISPKYDVRLTPHARSAS